MKTLRGSRTRTVSWSGGSPEEEKPDRGFNAGKGEALERMKAQESNGLRRYLKYGRFKCGFAFGAKP